MYIFTSFLCVCLCVCRSVYVPLKMSICRCVCNSFCPVFNVYTFWLCVRIYLYYVSINLPLLLSSHLILLVFFATRHMILPQISHGSSERHQQLRTGETNSRSHSNSDICFYSPSHITILAYSLSHTHFNSCDRSHILIHMLILTSSLSSHILLEQCIVGYFKTT